MKIVIKATNFSLTASLRNYVLQKLDRDLAKFVAGIHSDITAWVEIGKTTRHHHKGKIFRAEMQVRLPGDKTIRAEAEDTDLHVAIDRVRDIIAGECKKYKTRQFVLTKRRARTIKKDLKFAREARVWRKGRIREEGI